MLHFLMMKEKKLRLTKKEEPQNLSNKKYQTVLANGSTIASVNAIMNVTSATNINTVISSINIWVLYNFK